MLHTRPTFWHPFRTLGTRAEEHQKIGTAKRAYFWTPPTFGGGNANRTVGTRHEVDVPLPVHDYMRSPELLETRIEKQHLIRSMTPENQVWGILLWSTLRPPSGCNIFNYFYQHNYFQVFFVCVCSAGVVRFFPLLWFRL